MKYSIIFSLIVLSVCMYSCTEIFEKDIENETVVLVSPADSIVTYSNQHLFLWEPVDGAVEYELRIVKPAFYSIEEIVIDTTIEQTQFTYSLLPGEYQWGVKAKNVNYSTEFSIRNISVDTAKDFSLLQVILVSPVNNYATANADVILNWDYLQGADNYYYEIVESDWETGDVVASGYTVSNSVSLSLDEGVYFWGVMAQDDFSQTQTPFSYRALTIDMTQPQMPQAVFPANNDTVSLSELVNPYITFSWIRPADTGSEITDSICIYSDSLLTVPVLRTITTSTEYSFSISSYGRYYWYVRSVDAAGNISDYNSGIIRKFLYEE